jgi:hypothetical protein
MKPHLKLDNRMTWVYSDWRDGGELHSFWLCTGHFVEGRGRTPQAAYECWQHNIALYSSFGPEWRGCGDALGLARTNPNPQALLQL